MKQIKVSEELFEYLKKEAEANFRPIGKQIEFYLFGDPRVALKDIVKPQPTPKASKAIDRAVKKSAEAQKAVMDIPGVTKGIATKDTGPLYHVLDENDDTVETLPLQDAIKLKNAHEGWDMVRA